MDELSQELFAKIDAFVDGEMEGDELQEFERTIADNQQIKAEVERLVRVDRELKDGFASVASSSLHSGVVEPIAGARLSTKRFMIPLGIAASLALLAGVWSMNFGVSPNTGTLPIDGSVVLTAFLNNPVPDVVCDTEPKFIAYTQQKLGQAITARFDSGVALIGWRGVGVYEDTDLDAPRVLMARNADGIASVVVFQSADSAAPVVKGARPGVQMYRRDFGTVSAWEFSEADTNFVLDLLSIAD